MEIGDADFDMRTYIDQELIKAIRKPLEAAERRAVDELLNGDGQSDGPTGILIPEPLRISDSLREQLLALCTRNNSNPERVAPNQLFGFRVIVDDSVPKGRVGFLDARGDLRLL